MKERIIEKLETEIERYRNINQDLMSAPKTGIPPWTEIEQNRGYILGLRSAIMIINNMTEETRDCDNCKHHTENGCDSWDCEFEPIEVKSDSDWGCRNCKYFTKFYVPPVDSYKGQSDGFCCTCFKEFAMWLGSNKEQAGNGMCEKFSEVKPNEHM